MKTTISGALVTATLIVASACGGGASDDRPTTSAVSDALSGHKSMFGTTIPGPAVNCVAKALVDSDLSDEALKAIVNGDKSVAGDKDDEKALQELTVKFGECVTK